MPAAGDTVAYYYAPTRWEGPPKVNRATVKIVHDDDTITLVMGTPDETKRVNNALGIDSDAWATRERVGRCPPGAPIAGTWEEWT